MDKSEWNVAMGIFYAYKCSFSHSTIQFEEIFNENYWHLSIIRLYSAEFSEILVFYNILQ